MSPRAFRLVVTASIAAALLAPALEARHQPDTSPAHERVERVRGRDDLARRERDRSGPRPADYHQTRERCGGDGAGSILGAIAGGLLGTSATDRHPNRSAGMLVSAERDCD